MLLFIFAAGLALVVSFLCSLLEACLLSVSLTDIARMSEKRPAIAETWKGFKNNIQRPIAVILIINTLAHTIGVAISGSQFGLLFSPKWVWVYSIVFSIIMIQWTEILPKMLGVRHNRSLATFIAVPLKYAIRIFSPVMSLMEWLNRPFEGKRIARVKDDALGEIAVLSRFAAFSNLITPEQSNIVARSIKLSSTKVQDVMVARNDIKILSASMTLMEALIEAHVHHHTRYLLIQDNDLDKVIGYVNMKDIVTALHINPKDPSLKGIARPISTVGPLEKLSTHLRGLIKSHQHMAVVKDEQERTVGLITMEDIIETIVGQIEDEYDILPKFVNRLSDTSFMLGGGVSLDMARAKTGFNIPDIQTSVNDWLLGLHRKRPRANTRITYEDLVFIVRKTRRSKIHEVIVEKKK